MKIARNTIKNAAYAAIITTLVTAFSSAPAMADCTSPASPEGGLAYFTSNDTYRLCNGSDAWVPLATTSTGVFELQAGIVRNSGDIDTEDFTFGSRFLSNDAGTTTDDKRMWFDKSKGAFRAGEAILTRWDDGNVGTNSFATGYNNLANSTNSFAMGSSNAAMATTAFAIGTSATVSGTRSGAMSLSSQVGGVTVSGGSALGIFLTDVGGYNFNNANAMGIIGGNLIVDAGGLRSSTAITDTVHINGGNGDAILALIADSDNSGENDNPWITMSQDGGLTGAQANIGMSGGASTAFNRAIIHLDANALVLDRAGPTAIQFSTNGSRRMSIEGNGDVSIGMATAANDAKFGVRGDNLGASSGDTSLIAQFRSLTPNTDKLRILRRRNAAGGTWQNTEMRIQRLIDAVPMGYMAFGEHTGTDEPLISWGENVTEYMRLDSLGQLGIGTTAPNDGMLEVKGGSVCVDTNSDNNATSCISNESDIRLKKNIKTIESAVDKIKQIRGVEFDWRWDEYDTVSRWEVKPHAMGVIAQEIEKVFPEAMGEEVDGFKTVEYEYLTAPLIEAVKELSAQNDQLKADNQEIHKTLTDLQKQVDLLNNATINNAGKAGFDLWTLLMLAAIFGGSSLLLLINNLIRTRKG